MITIARVLKSIVTVGNQLSTNRKAEPVEHARLSGTVHRLVAVKKELVARAPA